MHTNVPNGCAKMALVTLEQNGIYFLIIKNFEQNDKYF